MDFHDFTDLRQGAPPCVLQRSFVAQNEQFWVLREYHLFKSEEGCATPNRLPPSDALAGFIPRLRLRQGSEDQQFSTMAATGPGAAQWARARMDVQFEWRAAHAFNATSGVELRGG